jgi:hypothetical protein
MSVAAMPTSLAAQRDRGAAPIRAGRSTPLPELARLLASHRELELEGRTP